MDEDTQFTIEDLERCSYRYLQQWAKSFRLPSNVKKVYLIQLIYAKKYLSHEEVEDIVAQVKLERQRTSSKCVSKKKTRKKPRVIRESDLQGTEISSTNIHGSPPISGTPKRPLLLPYSPELHPVKTQRKSVQIQQTLQPRQTLQSRLNLQSQQNSQPEQSLTRICTQLQSKQSILLPKSQSGSDRVLRSFNLKQYQKPNYSILNNSIIGVIKAQRDNNRTISIVSQSGSFPTVNLTARCILKTLGPGVLNKTSVTANQLVPVTCNVAIQTTPAKKRRTLSGIYPIATQTNTLALQNVGFRRTDGKISTIKALVQKPVTKKKPVPILTPVPVQKPVQLEKLNTDFATPSTDNSFKSIGDTIQDIINSNIEDQSFSTTDSNVENVSYPNLSSATEMPDTVMSETENDSTEGSFSAYYHKKIRAEQVRCQRFTDQVPVDTLPRITDVFSRFGDAGVNRDVYQPLYVQVSEESDQIQNCPMNCPNNSMLESLYNFKMSYVTSEPLLKIATTSNTTTVYSTPVIATAMQQPTIPTAEFAPCPQERQSMQNDVSRSCDLLQLAEQEITLRQYHEAYNTSMSSVETLETQPSQELSASIPEMVEDALELISQDGDYMERIEMDVRMQCILCSWAGPMIILEYHIRKEHLDQITQQTKSEWNVTYKLGSLVNQDIWLSQVAEYKSVLYVLSLRYTDPELLQVSMSILSAAESAAAITVYNKVSGEPFTWRGRLYPLSPDMPYENTASCLQVQLSSLALLPTSAGLQLLNKELVLTSPARVVVGTPELNDIHIIVFVSVEQ